MTAPATTVPATAAAGTAPDLSYPFPAVPAEGAVLDVADGISWVRMPLPFALDHINLWLLRDGDGWVVVDCGVASNRTRTAWEAVFDTALAGRPVTRVIVTHFHPDHMGLGAWICERFGAELLMTQTEWLYARLLSQDRSASMAESSRQFYALAGLDEERLAAMAQRGNPYPHGVPEVPATYRRLRHGTRLGIGGRTWQVIVGGGHSPEHACLWCAEAGILISGDQVLPRISPNVSVWPAEPDADPIMDFLDALARLETLPEETLVLPSHGLPFHGLRPRCRQLTEHHRERFEETLAACAEAPRTVMDLTAILFRRPLDTHQLSFAVGEALAHLNHLLVQGTLRRELDRAGILRFRTVG